MKSPTLLILGGTHEAYQLAEKLVNETSVSHFRIFTSLSGATTNPRLPFGPYRIGSFGGVSGLIQFLEEEKVLAVIDATHPYAVQISKNAFSATNHTAIPLIRLDRPAWVSKEKDKWIEVSDVKSAVEWIRKNPQRTLLTIGQRDLSEFRNCPSSHFIIRSIEVSKISESLPAAEWLHSRGPFTIDAEIELIKNHKVSVLVTKNSGGESSYPKLLAARRLGITVIMIQRPKLPRVKIAKDLNKVVMWCREL